MEQEEFQGRLKQGKGRWSGNFGFQWISILVFIILAALLLVLLYSYTRSEEEELYLTPVQQDNNGWDIWQSGEGGKPDLVEAWMDSDVVCLSRILEKEYEEQGYTTLKLRGDEWSYAAFLDGELFYSNTSGSKEQKVDSGSDTGIFKPMEPLLVTLPSDYAGKRLTLVCRRPVGSAQMPMVILTSETIKETVTVAATSALAIPAAVFMTVLMILLALLLYGAAQRQWDWSLFLLTLAAAAQLFYQLREYSMRLRGSFVLDIPAMALVPALFVLLPLGYLLIKMNHLQRWMLLLTGIPAAISLLPGFCNILAVSLPANSYSVCMAALCISVVVTLVLVIRDAWRGNPLLLLFLKSFGILLSVLLLACLFSLAGDRRLAEYMATVCRYGVSGILELPLFWCGVILFILCTVLTIEEMIRHLAESRIQADLLSTQVSALRHRLEDSQTAENAMRIERHDFRHRLLTVASLIEQGDQQTALDYIGAAQRHLDEITPECWCSNPVLDAVFRYYFTQAKEQHIRIEAELIMPESLPADVSELSIVFANALENAIRACMELPEEKREIQCRSRVCSRLILQVDNPYLGEIRFDREGRPVTTRKGHGTGTQSIAAFCKKYNAIWDYQAEDGWFRLRIAV